MLTKLSTNFFAITTFALVCSFAQAQISSSVSVDGLDQSVEILKDKWGISHIYAETEHDLFFCPGI